MKRSLLVVIALLIYVGSILPANWRQAGQTIYTDASAASSCSNTCRSHGGWDSSARGWYCNANKYGAYLCYCLCNS